MKQKVLFLLLAGSFLPLCSEAELPPPEERAKQLKAFLSKEKPGFEKREAVRLGILGEMDRLNRSQNKVRNRIGEIHANKQELQMALENLSMEVEKHRSIEKEQKQRFLKLMKLVNKIRQDGAISFALSGSDLTEMAARVRVLFRTLRMHSLIADQLQERTLRLAESEKKLGEAKESVHLLLSEMTQQEALLKTFLAKKKSMVAQLSLKQNRYRAAMAEWGLVSKELNELFQSLEADREEQPVLSSDKRVVALPLETGHLVKPFGKYIHPQFGTVTFHKGVEIEAEQNAPVHAVLDGVVEFEGWVRGLGNVLILHHGNGFYSLHAHLYKALMTQGAEVKKGDTIGLVGDTGNSEKPGLYFELRENGKAVDPTRYFTKTDLKTILGPTVTMN